MWLREDVITRLEVQHSEVYFIVVAYFMGTRQVCKVVCSHVILKQDIHNS